MKLKEPKNKNYAATVVTLQHFTDLNNCDNLQGTIIEGNCVITSNDAKVGDRGIYFPLESKLSEEFLSANNLYRDPIYNEDKVTKDYFEKHGRVRCANFRGNKSQGFYLPLSYLSKFVSIEELATLQDGDTFDKLNGIPICEKYIPSDYKTPGEPGSKKPFDPLRNRMTNIMVDKQFKFHGETSHLAKNLHKITKESYISITDKLHGSSCILSNVLIKRTLKWYEKFAKKLGIKVEELYYGYIYSSGKPASNLPKGIIGAYENPNPQHYKSNIWKRAFDDYQYALEKGITLYGELVGFTESGAYIQSDYDYGCEPSKRYIDENGFETIEFNQDYKFYIYKITTTNIDGQSIKFSWGQVKEYCKKYGLLHVPEFYYGRAGGFYPCDGSDDCSQKFLESVQYSFNIDKDCTICQNKVPAEGVVLSIDSMYEDLSFKLKTHGFHQKETADLDAGVLDIETAESINE